MSRGPPLYRVSQALLFSPDELVIMIPILRHAPVNTHIRAKEISHYLNQQLATYISDVFTKGLIGSGLMAVSSLDSPLIMPSNCNHWHTGYC